MIGFERTLKGKKIFITGHTGFTGSWACIWLNSMGAEVFGYSLKPESESNLFKDARVADLVNGEEADIRDYDKLRRSMADFKPDLVLHLAAQSLVRRGYRIPRETFETNVMGTVNVIEAAKSVSSVQGLLCITTDKVYQNAENAQQFRESDELGGSDPYSASKAAAELVIASYRKLQRVDESPAISVARGGNIIGGGDWSEDRLIPDFIRAHLSGEELRVRYLGATRPWQHVLSLLDGYFTILEGLLSSDAAKFQTAFNLGPLNEIPLSVKDVLRELNSYFPHVKVMEETATLPESLTLHLDSSFAAETFGWNPAWSSAEAIQKTAEWYRMYTTPNADPLKLCMDQIASWRQAKFDAES